MTITHYYGRNTNLVGKTIFEILCNLKNFGINRMIIKQEETLLNPGTKCYYIIKKVEPVMDSKLEEGAAWAERIYRNAKVPGLVYIDQTSWHSDWQLIPKTQEAECEDQHLFEHAQPKKLSLFPPLLQIYLKNSKILSDGFMTFNSNLTNKPDSKSRLDGDNKADLESNATPQSAPPPTNNEVDIPKKSIWQKVKHEMKHYWTGLKLLWMDVRISTRYIRKILKGEKLSRREQQQLVRTGSDVFRLVPFSVFLIVPFMEFLLPVYIKLFPKMLPSTFMTSKDKATTQSKQLQVKLDVAKFLQESLDEFAQRSKGKKISAEAEKFAKFFEEVRASGTGASNTDILKYSRLFEDEITLDSMTRPQLVACCKLLELKPIGTNGYLRYQLKTRLESLKVDDEMIYKEGMETLTVSELQAACRARGMRALGVPIERLQAQLKEWLELSLDEKIPASLLLLSRALFVPENIPTSEQLKVTIQSLPELAGTEVEYNLAKTEGAVDNQTKLEFIEQEEAEIQKEEKQEETGSFKSTYDEDVIDLAEEIIERASKMNNATILKIVKQKSEKNDLTIEFLKAVDHDLDLMLLQQNETVPSETKCFLSNDKYIYSYRPMLQSFPNRGRHVINGAFNRTGQSFVTHNKRVL